MPGVAASDLHADLGWRKVELVVKDGERARVELVEAQRLPDASTGFVHEGLRREQQDPLASDDAFGREAGEAGRNGPKRCAAAIASSAMKPMLWRLRA